MSATGSTTHYDLPVYAPNDVTSWLTDFNGAMEKIDAAIYEASQMGVEVVQTTGTSTTSVMSQNAVTEAINNIPTPPSITIDQTTGQSTTSVMSQKAVTDALNAIPQTQLTSQEGFSDTIGASQQLVAKCGNTSNGKSYYFNTQVTNLGDQGDTIVVYQIGGNIDYNLYEGSDVAFSYTGGSTYPNATLKLTAPPNLPVTPNSTLSGLPTLLPVYVQNMTTFAISNANTHYVQATIQLNGDLTNGYNYTISSTQLKTAFEGTSGTPYIVFPFNTPMSAVRAS